MQGELDLFGVVVSDVPREASKDAPEKVPKDVLTATVDTLRCSRTDVSTTRINIRGAEESS